MSRRCPLCNQELPKSLDERELHQRLEGLNDAAIRRERQRWEKESRARLERERTAIRESGVKLGRAGARSEIAELNRRVKDVERRKDREVELAGKRAAKEVAKQNQYEMQFVKERTDKERAQHQAETARLKATIDNLQVRLERQTSEQLGERCEVNVYSVLKATFPADDITRIGRGTKGADIVQRVIEDGHELGRIVYECKNVSTWQNEWIAKAKRYRSEYQTPWVVVATRTFPRKGRSFAVEKGVPVIDLRLVGSLAEIIRASVVESGNLRLSHSGRQAKAQQMFEYILSEHFSERFRGVADAISGLRDHQRKERQWHEEAWEKQTRLHDEIDGRRREIATKIKGITGVAESGALRAVPAHSS